MRKLGQNFLYDPGILSRIIQAADLSEEDTVVEIGPGPGTLTRMLAEKVRRVIAVEVDRKLYEGLQEEITERGPFNIELHQGDALRFRYETIGPFKVVSNIPYQITTPLIFKLFEYKEGLRSMTLTVQKEVAERITARPGGKDYGVLSIMVQYYSKPELKFLIPRGAFRPVPRVDSACIKIELYTGGPSVHVADERLFFKIIRTAFSHRRKTLLNALKDLTPDIRKALEESAIEPSRRPETLSMEEFARLSEHISRLLS